MLRSRLRSMLQLLGALVTCAFLVVGLKAGVRGLPTPSTSSDPRGEERGEGPVRADEAARIELAPGDRAFANVTRVEVGERILRVAQHATPSPRLLVHCRRPTVVRLLI